MSDTVELLTSLKVSGTAKPKGSLRHVGHGRMVEQVSGSRPWRETVALAARTEFKKPPCSEAVEVTINVWLQRPKSHWTAKGELRANAPRRPVKRSSGDSDKLARNILDALAGIVYVDDSQVVGLHVEKRYVGKLGVDGWVHIIVERPL